MEKHQYGLDAVFKASNGKHRFNAVAPWTLGSSRSFVVKSCAVCRYAPLQELLGRSALDRHG